MQMMSNRYFETIRLEKHQDSDPTNDVCGSGRGTAGFTLMELILVLAMMVFAGIIFATGFPAAMKAYESAVDAANAQVMLSDSVFRLRGILETADPKKVNEYDMLVVEEGLKGEGIEDFEGVIDDDEKVFVSFRSFGTGYLTAVVGGGSKGIQITQIPIDWNGAPNYALAQTPMPLIPNTLSIGKNTHLYAKIEGITLEKDGESFNGVFAVEGLAITRDGVAIPSASIKDEALKIRIVVK